MPFELRNASGLWLLGLLVPLIVLYILKIRRQRLTVASTWLWQQAARDLLAKSPFRRLIVYPAMMRRIELASRSSSGADAVADARRGV